MEFLNKLYESNYFGIGLFAVISFLVVTFLVVLFFGKKDEQKRKLDNTYNNTDALNNNDINGFKEINNSVPLEVPVTPNVIDNVSQSVPVAPVTPVTPIAPVAPVAPVNFEQPAVVPVAPIEPVPIINPIETPVSDAIINPQVTPIVTPVTVATPVVPIINEAVQAPVSVPNTLDPVKINIPSEDSISPQKLEPVKIVIPDEVTQPKIEPVIAPVIKEEVAPIVTPVYENQPVIEEKPVAPIFNNNIDSKKEEINVPKIDFDAIAESISKELDELEKNTTNSSYQEIKVTPISDITTSEVKTPTSTVGSGSQFSSVYVTPQREQEMPGVDLPKKIDLPTKRSE